MSDTDADGIEYEGYNTSSIMADSDGDVCRDGREIAAVNNNLNVNSVDLLLVAQQFAVLNSLAQLDVNKDGRVNSVDVLVIAKNFNSFPCR